MVDLKYNTLDYNVSANVETSYRLKVLFRVCWRNKKEVYMKSIFKNIEIVTNLDKNITTWAWHFIYKGKDYFGFLSNRTYKYKPYHCMPIMKPRNIAPKEQISLFEGMIKCMKELI